METLELMDEFKADPKFTEYINEGKFGEVYQLDKKLVGKFLLENAFNYKELQSEYEICKLAYENGISVPKPEGVFMVEHPEKNEIYPAFVMEYLMGKTIIEIFGQEKASENYFRAKKLLENEQEKARKLNFLIMDSNINNAIWCPKKEKVYLIDFGLWKIKK